MKFLGLVMGIDNTSSTYSCFWCKSPSADHFDADKSGSIIDTSKGARTMYENCQLGKLLKSGKKFNVSNVPIFSTFPTHNTVINNLHIFLRICDDSLINFSHKYHHLKHPKSITEVQLCIVVFD